MSELGSFFLTSPVCNRIAPDLDDRDHTALDDILGCLSLDDVKSYNTNRNLLLYKNVTLLL